MGLLSVENLSLSFEDKKIIDGLTLDFEEGKIHALVGPNGAGKSTFSCILMGLGNYREFDGDIIFDGSSIRNDTVDQRARKGMTLGWQEPARYEGLTVEKFVKGAAKNATDGQIDHALHVVGIDPRRYKERAVDRTLSGGERKKIELASILVMKPRFVMLDEPDSGIDVASLEKIFEAISILKREGSTILLITHSLTVLKQAEHAFLICCGRLVDEGPVSKIQPYFETKCIPCDHKNKPQMG